PVRVQEQHAVFALGEVAIAGHVSHGDTECGKWRGASAQRRWTTSPALTGTAPRAVPTSSRPGQSIPSAVPEAALPPRRGTVTSRPSVAHKTRYPCPRPLASAAPGRN